MEQNFAGRLSGISYGASSEYMVRCIQVWLALSIQVY